MAWDADTRHDVADLFALLTVPDAPARSRAPHSLWAPPSHPYGSRPVGDQREIARAKERADREAEARAHLQRLRAARADGQTLAQISAWSGMPVATVSAHLRGVVARPRTRKATPA